jgi:hypothetical protein
MSENITINSRDDMPTYKSPNSGKVYSARTIALRALRPEDSLFIEADTFTEAAALRKSWVQCARRLRIRLVSRVDRDKPGIWLCLNMNARSSEAF